MNKILKYILPLVALLFAFGACSKDNQEGMRYVEGKGNTVRFSLNMGLRATGDETAVDVVPAFEREKKVTKLYAVIYFAGDGRHFKTIECTPVAGANGTYEFDATRPESFYFYLVANPSADLVVKLEDEALTEEHLGNLIADQTPGDDDQADNFLMTSDRVEVTTVASATTTVPDVIKLTRLSARFDFINEVPDLVITKIEARTRYGESHLFAQVNKMDLLNLSQKSYNLNLVGSSVTGDASREYKGHVYSYENDQRGKTYFVIEATHKGKLLDGIEVRLENFVIKRNYIYEIHFKDFNEDGPIDDPETCPINFTIVVKDWGVEEFSHNPDRPSRVDVSASLPYASYNDAFLKDSPTLVWTRSYKPEEIELTVSSYYGPATLEFNKNDVVEKPIIPVTNVLQSTPSDPEVATVTQSDVQLTKVGRATKDPVTGKYYQKYKMKLFDLTNYRKLIPTSDYSPGSYLTKRSDWDSSSRGRVTQNVQSQSPYPYLTHFNFYAIPLIATSADGSEQIDLTVVHGAPEFGLELMAEKNCLVKTEGGKTFFVFDEEMTIPEINEYYDPNSDVKPSSASTEYESYQICNASGNPLDASAYRIPGKDEWLQIFPSFTHDAHMTHYLGKNAVNNENPQESFYTPNGNEGKITYGVKFRNGSNDEDYKTDALIWSTFQTAYRYEWINVEKRDIAPGQPYTTAVLKITARYLGPNWNGSTREIANEAFWNNSKLKANDVVRTLPLLGYVSVSDTTKAQEMGYNALYYSRNSYNNGSYTHSLLLNYYTGAGYLSYQDIHPQKEQQGKVFNLRLFKMERARMY